MTDDIVTRLRSWVAVPSKFDHMGRISEFHEVKDLRIFHEAADEIERLRAEVSRLGSFLHPIGTVINELEVRGE